MHDLKIVKKNRGDKMNSILYGVSKINYGVKIRMKSREIQMNYLRTFYSPSLYAKFKSAMEYPLDDCTIVERILNPAKRCGKMEQIVWDLMQHN